VKSLRAPLAEFLGTFGFFFAGIAAIVGSSSAMPGGGNGLGLLGIALAHGLALSVAVNVFGGISGAHFTPAVTAGTLHVGRITPATAAAYVIVRSSRLAPPPRHSGRSSRAAGSRQSGLAVACAGDGRRWLQNRGRRFLMTRSSAPRSTSVARA
jgi:hypothetical protein